MKKKNGVVLGRPVGKTTPVEKMKLYPKKEQIIAWRKDGVSYMEIGRRLGVHRVTVSNFIHTLGGNQS